MKHQNYYKHHHHVIFNLLQTHPSVRVVTSHYQYECCCLFAVPHIVTFTSEDESGYEKCVLGLKTGSYDSQMLLCHASNDYSLASLVQLLGIHAEEMPCVMLEGSGGKLLC